MVMGTSWLVCSCFRGDGILRGAGQSRHQAMRRNARVAFVLGRGAGPPRGHEATPDRAVRRPNWGRPICATCSHARLVLVGRNESRALSLMSAVDVNSGTSITRTSRPPARRFGSTKTTRSPKRRGCRRGSFDDDDESPAWGKRGFQCGLVRLGGTSNICRTPPQKGSLSCRPDK